MQLHLIGFCEAHSGSQGLVIKCLVSDASQAGDIKGTQRCEHSVGRVCSVLQHQGDAELTQRDVNQKIGEVCGWVPLVSQE